LEVAFPNDNEPPLTIVVPVLFPAVKLLPAVEAKVEVLEEPNVVKEPVEAVVAPIAVELIPVAVVLK
jgi:hypothetical protein